MLRAVEGYRSAEREEDIQGKQVTRLGAVPVRSSRFVALEESPSQALNLSQPCPPACSKRLRQYVDRGFGESETTEGKRA